MDKLSLVLLGVVLTSSCSLAALSNVATPYFYNLTLTVTSDVSKGVIGKMIACLRIQTDTSTLTFHWGSALSPNPPEATPFTITKQEDLNVGTQSIPVAIAGINYDATQQMMTITTTPPDGSTKSFTAGNYVNVSMTYKMLSMTNDTKRLFYRQYINNDNSVSTLMCTNLSPTYARDVFPCLDDITLPASMNLTLIRPSTYQAISSMELKASVSGFEPGTQIDVFNTTTPFPMHTLGLCINSDMVRTAYTQTQSATSMVFWSRKDYSAATLSANMNFLGSYCSKVIDVMNAELDPPVLNIVFVPGLAETISTHGIIMMREDDYAGSYSSAQSEGRFKKLIVPFIKHCIRQYISFITRPKTWADLWISPAVENYMTGAILYTIGVPYDCPTDILVVGRQTALGLDELFTSKPLADPTINTDSTAAIEASIMDPLKSLKGAALLTMLDMSLPAGVVFNAIKAYIGNYKLKSAGTDELCAQIIYNATNSGGYTSAAMRTAVNNVSPWFKERGFPMGNMNVINTGVSGSVELNLATLPESNFRLVQYVGVTVGSRSDPRFYTPRQDIWLTPQGVNQVPLTVNTGDWIMENIKGSSYMRTNWTYDNSKELFKAIANNEIPEYGHLINDFAARASVGMIDWNFTIATCVLPIKKKENLYRNWYPVQRALNGVRDVFYNMPHYSSFQKFMRPFLLNVSTLLAGSSVDSLEAARMITLFTGDFCEFDIPAYRKTAADILSDLLTGVQPTTVPSSSYDVMTCCAAKYNTNLNARGMWNNVTNDTTSYYRKHYNALALGCLSNYITISGLFDTVLASNVLHKDHILTFFQALAEQHPINFIADVTTLASKIQDKIGAPSLANLIVTAGMRLNIKEYATPLSGIANAAVDDVVKTAATNTMTFVDLRIGWLLKHNVSLVTALENNALPSGGSTSDATTTILSLVMLIPIFFITLATL